MRAVVASLLLSLLGFSNAFAAEPFAVAKDVLNPQLSEASTNQWWNKLLVRQLVGKTFSEHLVSFQCSKNPDSLTVEMKRPKDEVVKYNLQFKNETISATQNFGAETLNANIPLNNYAIGATALCDNGKGFCSATVPVYATRSWEVSGGIKKGEKPKRDWEQVDPEYFVRLRICCENNACKEQLTKKIPGPSILEKAGDVLQKSGGRGTH